MPTYGVPSSNVDHTLANHHQRPRAARCRRGRGDRSRSCGGTTGSNRRRWRRAARPIRATTTCSCRARRSARARSAGPIRRSSECRDRAATATRRAAGRGNTCWRRGRRAASASRRAACTRVVVSPPFEIDEQRGALRRKLRRARHFAQEPFDARPDTPMTSIRALVRRSHNVHPVHFLHYVHAMQTHPVRRSPVRQHPRHAIARRRTPRHDRDEPDAGIGGRPEGAAGRRQRDRRRGHRRRGARRRSSRA